jgi:lysozyme
MMTLHPRLPRSGVELVKRFEGLRLKAARLPDGRWTIGYGHTASAREGAEVTAEDAEALLLYDLGRVALIVDEAVLSPLNENQFAALVAFAFNVGPERFTRSEVLRRLNEGSYLQAAAALEMWRRSDFEGESIVVDALVRRRAAEKILFLTPPDGFRPVPTPLIRPEQDRQALAGAEELEVRVEDDAASVERRRTDTEGAVAPTIAARSVIERLNAILADEPVPPPPEPVEIPAPPVEVAEEAPLAPVERAEPPPFPEAAPAAPVVALQPPAVEPVAPPAVEAAATPETPREHHSTPRWTVHELELPAEEEEQEEPQQAGFAVLSLGVFGLALFLAALTTIVFGRATWINLALGLAGIAFMAPAAVRLISTRFGGGRD